MSRIIIPKQRDLVVAVRSNIAIKGFMRFETFNKFSGKRTQDTGWFPNTILDSGRNVMATRSDWIDWCQVGLDGTFPPTLPERQAETALGTWFAGTNTVVSGSTLNGQSGTAPYYGWKRKTFRFDIGTFDGDILAEAGIGWGVDGSQLISRAPILDPILQTPTTITPQSDEFLNVSYELRYYAPTVDVLGPQVILDGITYDTKTRAANVTGADWSSGIGSAIGARASYGWTAYDDVIGTVLTGPNGVAANADNNSQYNSGYSSNSYEIEMNCNVGSSGWNLGSGIKSILIPTMAGDYQTQFDGSQTIQKTVLYEMSMKWTISWAELP